MKIVFFGSDDFSIKSLEACLHSGVEIPLVVTTPAKKKGRGLHVEPTPVFDYCQAKKIPVAEFPTLRNPNVADTLRSLQPDLFVVASYGKLIPTDLLEIPKYRLNVHPSLLPKYRGASPLHFPILNGDAETGVTILDIAEALDSGDIYCQEKFVLPPRINSAELAAQLAALSYGLLKKTLQQIREGKLQGVPQNEAEATLAPQLDKKDGEVSLELPAEAIDRKVRGLQPWPGCYCFYQGSRIALLETDLAQPETDQKPGTLLSIEKSGSIHVATSKGVLVLIRLKPEGKKEMTAADFARGRHLAPGMLFL